jgi:hypothetical protein
MQEEQRIQPDEFELMLRRQGWHLIRHRPIQTDPRVIRLPPQDGQDEAYVRQLFYEAFGDNTFRKLLRHIFFHKQCPYDDLRRICRGTEKLDSHLAFMLHHRLIEREGDTIYKGGAYQHIDNLGPTLEWYVAEWFRTWLQVPARHGVSIKGVVDGGDMDVVAFVESIRVMVECKSGSAAQITENEFKLFLRRAAEFNPEIAVLLIDTESRLDPQIELLNRLRTGGDEIRTQDNHRSLYWGARHIYVVNTRVSIGDSLSAVLRLYFSKVRHIAFWRLSL